MAADQEATSLPRLQVLGIVLGSPAQLAGMRQVGSSWEAVRKEETGYRVSRLICDSAFRVEGLKGKAPGDSDAPSVNSGPDRCGIVMLAFDTQGDEIVAVNGTAVAGSSPFETSSLIQSSSKGKDVTIQVLTPSQAQQPLSLSLFMTRDRWEAMIDRLIAFQSLCSIATHTVSALPLPLSPSPGHLT